MTKTDSAYIGQNRQRNNDGSSVVWPAADNSGALPPLGYNADDLFIGNYGLDTVYVSTDGLTTLTFGASLVGGSFSGTASDNTVAIPYSGPYLTVAPGSFDKTDPAFRGLIELGYAEPFRDDNTGRIPIHWHSGGSLVHGAHHAPESVHYPQLHRAFHERGHFAGGVVRLIAGPALELLPTRAVTPDTFCFVTDNGDGDGTLPGAFAIYGPSHTGMEAIAPNGSSGWASVFSSATPGRHLITFTRLFPAATTLVSTTAGSLSTIITYTFRYCFTRTFGGVTLESALSAPVQLTGATGYVLNVDKIPNGWTGIRMYINQSAVSGTYNSGTNQITVTDAGSALQASYGFFAWAPGTIITAIPDLMKLGHLDGQQSAASASGGPLYGFHGTHPGAHEGIVDNHAPQSITGGQPIGGVNMPNHLTPSSVHYSHLQSFTTTASVTPFAAHKVVAADGAGAVVYEDPVPAAGSIVASMIANGTITDAQVSVTAAISGNKLANTSIHAPKLSMSDISFAAFDITTGKDNTNTSTALSAWTVDVWYYVTATWGTFTVIGPYSQLLAQVTSDATGATGYGDMGPVTYYRGSSGVYTDDPTHPPSGTPPQPLLIAEQADTAELLLTKLTNDYAGTVTLHGWARWRGANRPTKITVNFQLLGVIS